MTTTTALDSTYGLVDLTSHEPPQLQELPRTDGYFALLSLYLPVSLS